MLEAICPVSLKSLRLHLLMEETERFQHWPDCFISFAPPWLGNTAERHLAKPHFKVDGWQVIWSCDSPSLRVVAATRDLTNRAKDTFNILPGRHYLSWCNFRLTKGRNTRKLGRMLMAWKHQQRLDCSLIFLWSVSFWRKHKGTVGSRPNMK